MALKSTTTTLATIQMRRGAEENFDPEQMTAGEWAVSTDSKKVWMCFQPGLVLRMATYEAFEEDMEEIRIILVEAQDIQAAIEKWNYLAESYAHGGTGKREGEDTDNAKYYSEQAKASADKAAAVSDIGIMTTEKAGIGKPDGTTITVDEDGTMHSVGGGGAEGDFASKAIYGDSSINKGRVPGSDIGINSVSFGNDLISSGYGSVSFGWKSKSTNTRSVSFGYNNTSSGANALSCGGNNLSKGTSSFSSGENNSAFSDSSHASGGGCVSVGYGSNSEGLQTISGNGYILHVKSVDVSAKKIVFTETYDGFSEAFSKLSAGVVLHIMNIKYVDTASMFTVSSVDSTNHSVVVEENIPSSGFAPWLAVLSVENTVSSTSHSEGKRTIAKGENSHAEGEETIAKGKNSHAEGYYTIALSHQHAQGHYNDVSKATDSSMSGTGMGTAFVIGNGTSITPSNAARIDCNGKLWCKQAYSSTGADYAELFEWEDGNLENEDRRGYFVTVCGKKIKKASVGDYIVGIISGNPSVIGNTDMEWYGQFMRDEFGTFLKENYKETVKYQSIDEYGNVAEEGHEIYVEFYKVNPDYDPDAPYTFRLDRPEWDAVGMVGVLPVRDDGTCEVGKFCKCADGGIATLAEERGFDTYMVIERVTENIVSVILK